MRRVTALSLSLLLATPPSASAIGELSVSTGALAFGSYSPVSGTATTATTSVSVNCTVCLLATYTLTFGPGLYGSLSTSRQMGPGTNRLNYDIYNTSGQKLGNPTTNPGTVDFTDSVVAGITYTKSWTINGTIPIHQVAPPGAYTDSITMTLTF